MAEQFSAEWARDIIDSGVEKAQGLMNDPEQLNSLLESLQEKIAGLPDTITTAFGNVPLMASMVKSYITREYTEVSPKVVISLISAIVYLVKQKDLIPDDIPIVGFADDIAVATIAMAINEPELKAYALWREQNGVSEAGASLQAEPIEIEAQTASSARVPETDVEQLAHNPIEVEVEVASPQTGEKSTA